MNLKRLTYLAMIKTNIVHRGNTQLTVNIVSYEGRLAGSCIASLGAVWLKFRLVFAVQVFLVDHGVTLTCDSGELREMKKEFNLLPYQVTLPCHTRDRAGDKKWVWPAAIPGKPHSLGIRGEERVQSAALPAGTPCWLAEGDGKGVQLLRYHLTSHTDLDVSGNVGIAIKMAGAVLVIIVTASISDMLLRWARRQRCKIPELIIINIHKSW